MNSLHTGSAARPRSRLSLVLLFALFLSPLIMAALIFFVVPQWRPSGTANHGQLVTPVHPLPAFKLETLDGKRIDETFLRGKWTIVYLLDGECGDSCVRQLYNIRQIRLAQGKNINRLQRLLLWKPDGVSAQSQAGLQEHFPGQVMASITGQEALLQAFAVDEHSVLQARRVYLVDPLGNLMMTYEGEDEPAGMIKDLERLLKYSGLG